MARAAAFIGLLLVTLVLAFAAIVGAAVVTVVPALFLVAGWVVLAVGVYLSARLAIAARFRQRIAGATLAVLTVAGGFSLLWPETGPAPAEPPGIRTLQLRTGSTLAYLELHGSGPDRIPVVFLHGGPGTPDMHNDAVYLRRLADSGYDVYLYDQLGAGRSERLSDPTGYTLTRAVADLDAFREAIRAPRLYLLGHSWGAMLGAAYLALHPDRVAKVVFASPGPMVGGASNVNDLLGRLGPDARWTVYWHALQPRALLAWTVTQVNPRAARAFASDSEMDYRFRQLSAAVAPALYCHPPPSVAGADVGFYANATLLRPSAWRGTDPHPALRRLHTPALILKGPCDYVSWSSAVDYRDTMPDARMVYLSGTGHQLYAERRDAFFTTVESFLADRPLPFPIETRINAPPDYQGPA